VAAVQEDGLTAEGLEDRVEVLPEPQVQQQTEVQLHNQVKLTQVLRSTQDFPELPTDPVPQTQQREQACTQVEEEAVQSKQAGILVKLHQGILLRIEPQVAKAEMVYLLISQD
jgi:hypothetical protein